MPSRAVCRPLQLLPLLLLLAASIECSGSHRVGLYSTADGVTPLDFGELKSVVYSQGRRMHWLLQLYHSSCGHCIVYSGAFKQLAKRLQPWRGSLRIAVVNLAQSYNIRALRHFGLSGVPALVYVAPNCSWSEKFSAALPTNTAELPGRLLDLMQPFIPQLAPLQPGEKPDCDFVMEEPRPGLLARSLILEALEQLSLRWRAAAVDSVRVSRVSANGSVTPLGSADSAASLRRLVGLPTSPNELASPAAAVAAANRGDDQPQAEAPRPPSRRDLQSALIRALVSDTALAGPRRPEVWKAARGLASLAAPLLPAAGRLAAAMPESPPADFADEDAAAAGWKRLLSDAGFPETPPDRWDACNGSKPFLRGYPCGLWQLFHTLTALRVQLGAAAPPVAPIMRAFIVSSFSCSHCGRNFARESADLPAEPMPPRQELLWLWRLHNRVNRRLAGQPSEDPAHPKLQFPPAALCARCAGSDDAASDFLLRWYSSRD